MTIERRNFLKTALLTIFSLYGFSEIMSCFAADKIPPPRHTGKGRYPFTGVYFGTVANERVSMPDEFFRSLVKGRFFFVVPERNTSALLVPKGGPEWEMLEQLFDAADKDGSLMLRERLKIDGQGHLCFPESVRKIAGIHTAAIAVIGHGYIIEIMDSARYYTHIV